MVFDREGMMARVLGDEDLARAVIEGFLDDMPRQIETLRGYIEGGDGAGVTRQAHTIKGASANIGGEALRAVALAMENAGREGDSGKIARLLPQMEREFGRLQNAMKGESVSRLRAAKATSPPA